MLDSRQMRVFHAADERTPKTEDSLAERIEFEPSDDLVNCEYVIMRRQADRTAEFEIRFASESCLGGCSARNRRNSPPPDGFIYIVFGTGRVVRAQDAAESCWSVHL